jgi:hypothetical protein
MTNEKLAAEVEICPKELELLATKSSMLRSAHLKSRVKAAEA